MVPNPVRLPQHTPSSSRRESPASRMPTLFNLIRVWIYGAVLLFTVICLAMAGSFQQVLAASDLTRFVPFAIFVCCASLLIILVLLGFSFSLRERNPISTRIELACLGLAGIFWLVLGVYLATSQSQSADVECFASASSTQPLDSSLASFHTNQYHAMYRVLTSFSLMNAALVLLFCLTLLFLAVRRHSKGDEHMWHGPVTSCAWFNSYGNVVKRNNSGSSSILPITGGQRKYAGEHSVPYTNVRPTDRQVYSEKPLPSPKRQNTIPKQHRSGNSSSIGSRSSTNEFERGGMINPNKR